MSGDGKGYAPAWVQSVTPAEIVRQRQLGWPDFHPEDFCHVCGHKIGAPWFASAETWGKVFNGEAGIVCPPCFTTLYAASVGSDRVGWELRVDWQDGEPVTDAARLRSLAAMFDSRLNRDKTYTGSEVASILRDGKGFDDSDIMPGSEFDGPVVL